jgi:hypothetical protein
VDASQGAADGCVHQTVFHNDVWKTLRIYGAKMKTRGRAMPMNECNKIVNQYGPGDFVRSTTIWSPVQPISAQPENSSRQIMNKENRLNPIAIIPTVLTESID